MNLAIKEPTQLKGHSSSHYAKLLLITVFDQLDTHNIFETSKYLPTTCRNIGVIMVPQ